MEEWNLLQALLRRTVEGLGLRAREVLLVGVVRLESQPAVGLRKQKSKTRRVNSEELQLPAVPVDRSAEYHRCGCLSCKACPCAHATHAALTRVEKIAGGHGPCIVQALILGLDDFHRTGGEQVISGDHSHLAMSDPKPSSLSSPHTSCFGAGAIVLLGLAQMFLHAASVTVPCPST